MTTPTPTQPSGQPDSIRIVRRYTDYGWQYQLQRLQPRFRFFGKLVWRDVGRPRGSAEVILRELGENIEHQKLLGKEEIVA